MKIIREARGMCAPIRAINMMGRGGEGGREWCGWQLGRFHKTRRNATHVLTPHKNGALLTAVPICSCLSLPSFSLFHPRFIYLFIYLFDIFLIRWRFLGETKINYDRFWFLPRVINALIISIFKKIIAWLMFCLLFYWRVHYLITFHFMCIN